jgi:hypothetical protein
MPVAKRSCLRYSGGHNNANTEWFQPLVLKLDPDFCVPSKQRAEIDGFFSFKLWFERYRSVHPLRR